jgi:hypothetical protein
VREVDELEPHWNGRWSLEHYLRVFDEAGGLRPIYRVHLPSRFAYFLAARDGLESSVQLDGTEEEEFHRLWVALQDLQVSIGDPESRDFSDHPPPELEGRIRKADAQEGVNWDEYELVVCHHQGTPVTRAFVYSFYGEWQRLRAWTLLEAYTFRGLMDPRRLQPAQVFDAAWDKNLRGCLMTWMVGDLRMLKLVDGLEADGWLRLLYLVRQVIDWGQFRVSDPRFAGWADGEGMSIDARAVAETARVRERCQTLGRTWLEDRAGFAARVRMLVELWTLASQASAAKFSATIEEDLWAAVRWAGFMNGDDLLTVDRTVGTVPPWHTTVLQVLRPTWSAARTSVDRYLPALVESFNREMGVVRLDAGDRERFEEFLERTELQAWFLEFSGLMSELQSPTDASRDRRFLHLRSLANLVEPILVALADARGTDVDRAKMTKGEVKEPMKAFLSDRRTDWRARLWEIVNENWPLTRTTREHPLSGQLDAIAAAASEPPLTQAARTILTLAGLRNFGSHRITSDPRLLGEYQGQLIRAVVWTPLLYWKVATTLG